MKISATAIQRITDNRQILLALAFALDFSEQWMRRILENNKSNGPLTTVKALEIIRQKTGLTDAEILEEETINEEIGKS